LTTKQEPNYTQKISNSITNNKLITVKKTQKEAKPINQQLGLVHL